MTDYICILDFEATCWDQHDRRYPNEIIEFPSVLLKWDNTPLHDVSKRKKYIVQEVARIQLYVKPAVNPIVSEFCTNLTGITQKQVDQGVDLRVAIETHLRWIASIAPTNKVTIVTHGDWDLKIMLPADLKNISYEPDELYTRYVNLKDLFNAIVPEKQGKGTGMVKMLNHLKLGLEGRHHSGIDDCHNIARMFIKLVDLSGGLDKKIFANNVKITNVSREIKHIYPEYILDEQKIGQEHAQKHKKIHNGKHGEKYNRRRNIKPMLAMCDKKQMQDKIPKDDQNNEQYFEQCFEQDNEHNNDNDNQHDGEQDIFNF